MKNILAVGVGGALGSLLRYGLYSFNILSVYPFGTFMVNLIGSFLLGIFTGWYSSKKGVTWVRLAIGVGFCGGFTTMSTFSSEVLTLFGQHSARDAILYVALSLFGGVLLAGVGLLLGIKIVRKGTDLKSGSSESQ